MATSTQSAYNKRADSAFDPTKWLSGMQKSARKNATKKKKKRTDTFSENIPTTESILRQFRNMSDPTGTETPGPKYYVNADQYAYPTAGGGGGALATLTPTPPPALAPLRTPDPDLPPALPPGSPGAANEDPGDVPMDKWTGWAAESGFDADMMDELYADPSLISRQWLKERGWSPTSGRMDSMGEIAELLDFWGAATMGTGGVGTGNPDDFLNFADMVFQGMMDPGGKGVPDFNQMIANILDAPEGSALKAGLEAGDFGDQANTFNSLIRAASALKTPFMRRAIEGMLENKTDEWMLANTRGRKDANGIADWFQKGGGGFFG
jgi:hypothetical protein